MRRTLILAGLSCGLAGVLAGCEGTPSASLTSSAEDNEVSGRVGLSQGLILVSDAKGDTVAKDSVKAGGFTLHIPAGTHFPVVLDVDSAGVHLKTILPGPPEPKLPIHITPLTDSAARALLGPKPGPGPIGPKEWKDKLDSLRHVVTDSLRPPKPKDTLRPPPPPKDSLGLPKPPKDTLGYPKPPKDSLGYPKPPKDTLRPPPAVRDSVLPAPV